MRLLILGGTSFLGRHVASLALERGHHVTLFHRGRTNPGLFSEAEVIHGDRKQDLHLLPAEVFDAVVDTCGYFPKHVRASVVTLKDRVGTYCFISSMSVYPTDEWPHVTEESPTLPPADIDADVMTGETYGPLKAACDQEVLEGVPGRGFVVRPGLIVGPHDPTDRFTYWVRRMARGGDVLAPEPRDRRTKWIDARDLAAFVLDGCEVGRAGVYDVVGPERGVPMAELLRIAAEVAGTEPRVEWVDGAFLEARGVAPWTDLPLWIPGIHDDFDCSRAIAAGLGFRPVEDTVRDTLWWDQLRDPSAPLKAGLIPEREAELLDAWRARG